MPRKAKEMKALEIRRLVYPVKEMKARQIAKSGKVNKGLIPQIFAVGGVAGLAIQITENNSKSWLMRTTVAGKRREFGLGSFPEVSLAQASELARDLKIKIRTGVDPIEERKLAKATLVTEQRMSMTFAEAVEGFADAKLDQYKTEKNRQLWRNMMENYATPVLGGMRLQDIEVRHVLQVVEPIWRTKTVTATTVRARVENVLDWASAKGHRVGDNPARWTGNLKELLPAPTKVSKVAHHAAIPIEQVADWFVDVNRCGGNGSRALEFLALTVARSGEVRGATWEEIDFERGLWTVSAERMKMDREHRVPLSATVVALLEALPHRAGLLFPSTRGGPLSDATLSATMKRINASGDGYFDRASKRPAVPHGLRSTFRDWASETTNFAGDLIETALAHKVSNAVEAAYAQAKKGRANKKQAQRDCALAAIREGGRTTREEIIAYAANLGCTLQSRMFSNELDTFLEANCGVTIKIEERGKHVYSG